MTHWFKLDAVDESFFDDAQYRYVFHMDLRSPADQVWAGLTAQRPHAWCRMLTHVAYTSPGPFAVGSQRASEVAWGALKFRERFFGWDDTARRHSFYVEEVNVPLVRAFAEDYQITPTDTGCRFTWTFAFDPNPSLSPAVRLGLPGIRLLLRSLVKDTEKAFGTARVPSPQTQGAGRPGEQRP
jgi:hypothetical protein